MRRFFHRLIERRAARRAERRRLYLAYLADCGRRWAALRAVLAVMDETEAAGD